MVDNRLKQNGHPVSPKDIGFNWQDKLYPKEACDVRVHYYTLFPLSSNKNYQSDSFSRCQRITYYGPTQQTFSTRLSWLRPNSLRCPQLGRTYRTRSEHHYCPSMDQMPLPQAVLSALPRCPYRGFGAFSSVPAGDPPDGSLRLSVMPHDDRLGGSAAPRFELENGQRHRQTFFGTRLRATGFKRVAYSGRRRDLNPQRSSLSDCGTGLSQRPRRICRQRSQGRHTHAVFQSAQHRAAHRHRSCGHGHVGPVYQSR